MSEPTRKSIFIQFQHIDSFPIARFHGEGDIFRVKFLPVRALN